MTLLDERRYGKKPIAAEMGVDSQALITFQEAAKILPGRPHYSTLWRWATSGLDGVRLRSVRVGRKRATTVAWLMEFFQRREPPDASDRPRTQRQRERAIQRAERELEHMGVLPTRPEA
jgi:hypothetical protein